MSEPERVDPRSVYPSSHAQLVMQALRRDDRIEAERLLLDLIVRLAQREKNSDPITVRPAGAGDG